MSATSAIPEGAVRRLSQLLLERVGLRPALESEIGLRLALTARLEALGDPDPTDYVARLEGGDERELRQLLPLVTVGKTDFFRDANQFRALRLRVLPELLGRARQAMRPLRIWSAGCATGEEPYSLAMLAADLKIEPDGIELLATDVNPSAVERAALGLFPARRLASLSPELLERYFEPEEGGYRAGPVLRAYPRFEVHNLAGGLFPLPRGGERWDLILCRNVLIYFDKPTTARVVARFHDLLADGGYLCLGYSESLYRISAAFELAEIEGSFLYSRPARAAPPTARRPLPPDRQSRPAVDSPRVAPELPASLQGPDSVPTSGSANGRGSELASRPVGGPINEPAGGSTRGLAGDPAGASASGQTGTRPASIHRTASGEAVVSADPVLLAAVLFDRGEFEHALEVVTQALERSPGNLSLQLTLGNMLLVTGRQAEARQAYLAALASEPLCAEAHLFLGIACFEAGVEHARDAMQALTRARFLDPNLGLAHYYAGRLAERDGDLPGARRAYRNAVAAFRVQAQSSPLLSYFPDLPADPAILGRAAQYALAAIEEEG